MTPGEPGGLRATFLGVSTILLDDGATRIMTDGFFTRPGLIKTLAGRLAPDREKVTGALTRFGVTGLDAVFVVHSHYDHALDSALVAELTGARVIGSESTRNIARGQGFPDERFDVVTTGQPIRVGGFTLTALPSVHSPGDLAPGTIGRLLTPPARARDYKTGECYSLHLQHGQGELIIHASANIVPGALDGYRAQTVYLGIGVLGKQSDDFRAAYWDALVTQTGATRVIPVHWDDFTRPLTKPLRPLPRIADNFEKSVEFLRRQAARQNVTVELPVLGQATDPFRVTGG